MQDTEKVALLYNKYVDKLNGISFHNLLWQLLINKNRSNEKSALTVVYTDNGQEIVIADKHKQGYTPASVVFEDGIRRDQANKICQHLNKVIFGLEPKEASEIVLSTL